MHIVIKDSVWIRIGIGALKVEVKEQITTNYSDNGIRKRVYSIQGSAMTEENGYCIIYNNEIINIDKAYFRRSIIHPISQPLSYAELEEEVKSNYRESHHKYIDIQWDLIPRLKLKIGGKQAYSRR